MTAPHPDDCDCRRVLLYSAPARTGIATALREVDAGRQAGRYVPRDGATVSPPE